MGLISFRGLSWFLPRDLAVGGKRLRITIHDLAFGDQAQLMTRDSYVKPVFQIHPRLCYDSDEEIVGNPADVGAGQLGAML